jgi:hypothetical protein
LLEPVVRLLHARAATEEDAHDVFAAGAPPALTGQRLRVTALVDALDLPDVDLDPEILQSTPVALGSAPRLSASSKPSKMSLFASAMASVSSGVGSPEIPNIFFWNDPR